jgi:uncharacterized membrane protein (UPF0127 family)
VFRQRNALGRWSAFASFKLVGLLQRVVGPLSLPAVLIFALALVSARSLTADLHTLEVVSKTGVHVFSIELAVSDEDRARGLMFRRELPDGQGMLFDFGRDQDVAMWMKNTLIPLDMMFITADGRIRRIAENTEPMSTRIIPSGGPVRAVLEVIGGTAKKYGIAAGDRVAHPWFR